MTTPTIFDDALNQWTLYHWFEFTIEYVIPIVGCISLILGGIWTVYQYFISKNREFNLQILNNVYSPLFQKLITNEYLREITKRKADNRKTKKSFCVDEIPFFSIIDSTEEQKSDTFDDVLLALIKDNERFKYAPRDLVALLNAYKALIDTKDVTSYSSQKRDLQKRIRKNVIIGYKRYRRKLGLKDVTFFKFMYSIRGKVIFYIR